MIARVSLEIALREEFELSCGSRTEKRPSDCLLVRRRQDFGKYSFGKGILTCGV